jgi:hypothetical protein
MTPRNQQHLSDLAFNLARSLVIVQDLRARIAGNDHLVACLREAAAFADEMPPLQRAFRLGAPDHEARNVSNQSHIAKVAMNADPLNGNAGGGCPNERQ